MVFPFATFVVIEVENANPSKINIGSGARAIADCVEVLVSYGTLYSQRTHFNNENSKWDKYSGGNCERFQMG